MDNNSTEILWWVTSKLQTCPSPQPPGSRGVFDIFESGYYKCPTMGQLKWEKAAKWTTEEVHCIVNKIYRWLLYFSWQIPHSGNCRVVKSPTYSWEGHGGGMGGMGVLGIDWYSPLLNTILKFLFQFVYDHFSSRFQCIFLVAVIINFLNMVDSGVPSKEGTCIWYFILCGIPRTVPPCILQTDEVRILSCEMSQDNLLLVFFKTRILSLT